MQTDYKKSLKSTYGFDAGGQEIVNVKTPQKGTLNSAVNIDYFIKYGTVQDYEENRAYEAGFVVIHNGKLYVTPQEIKAPSGPFNFSVWAPVRTDNTYKIIKTATEAKPHQLKLGDYIAADTSANELFFNMPTDNVVGDTVVIHDIGGSVGIRKLVVNKTNNRQIEFYGDRYDQFMFTRPNAQVMFIYTGSIWKAYVTDSPEKVTFFGAGATGQPVQCGDTIYGETSKGQIKLILPKYALHGDIVKVFDIDGLLSTNPIQITTHADSSDFVKESGLKETVLYSNGMYLLYDGKAKTWKIWDADTRGRIRIIKSDFDLRPNDKVFTFGLDDTTAKTITLTLPKKADTGTTVDVSTNFIKANQKVVIKSQDDLPITINSKLLKYPKRSDLPTAAMETSTTITIDGAKDYAQFLSFAYIDDPVKPYWLVNQLNPVIEQVDPLHRTRLGVIALASQTEANVDKGKNPNKQVAITPETLANRTATETRQGILRTATAAELLIDSSAVHDKLIAVTPFTLNERIPTENRRGVVSIATQAEVNAGVVDNEFVSPKKLHARKATEGLTGIIALMKVGGVPKVDGIRGDAGTGIYQLTEHTRAVTSKTLHELKATENAAGLVNLASESETIAGVSQDRAKFPVAVAPEQLHKKTATLDRIGFTQTASQTEVNKGTDNFKYVTPKTLNDRKASETLTGIAKLATQAEFDAGNAITISTPSVVKDFLSRPARLLGDAATGVDIVSNIWEGATVKTRYATTGQTGTIKIATEAEAIDKKILTKTLAPGHLSKILATETYDGLIRVATLNESITGTLKNVAISPFNMISIKNHDTAWKANDTTNGFIRTATDLEGFTGNNLVGSTLAIDEYKNDIAVSPRNLNVALANFLPKTATAVNSDKLGNRLPAEYAVKANKESVSGAWTFTSLQTFTKAISVNGASRLETSTFDGAEPQILIKPKSNAVNSVINLTTKTGKIWSAQTDEDNFKILNGANAAITIDSANNTSFNAKKISGITTAEITNGITLGGVSYLTKTGTNTKFGDKKVSLEIQSVDASNIAVNDSGANFKMITTKNIKEETAKDFLEIIGGTLRGKLIINNFSVKPIKKEGLIEPTISDDGIWLNEVKTKANFDSYPPTDFKAREISDSGVAYLEKTHGPGTLFTATSSKSSGFQIWTPNGSTKKYIRSSNSDGTWGAFEDIITSSNLPTPAEIGAVAADGLSFEDLKIKGFIQIGNIRLVPNPKTKSCDILWIDEE